MENKTKIVIIQMDRIRGQLTTAWNVRNEQRVVRTCCLVRVSSMIGTSIGAARSTSLRYGEAFSSPSLRSSNTLVSQSHTVDQNSMACIPTD